MSLVTRFYFELSTKQLKIGWTFYFTLWYVITEWRSTMTTQHNKFINNHLWQERADQFKSQCVRTWRQANWIRIRNLTLTVCVITFSGHSHFHFISLVCQRHEVRESLQQVVLSYLQLWAPVHYYSEVMVSTFMQFDQFVGTFISSIVIKKSGEWMNGNHPIRLWLRKRIYYVLLSISEALHCQYLVRCEAVTPNPNDIRELRVKEVQNVSRQFFCSWRHIEWVDCTNWPSHAIKEWATGLRMGARPFWMWWNDGECETRD